MSSHFTQEEFILAYYEEPSLGARREHLAACGDCRAELGRLARVLDEIKPMDVPEPDQAYESRVWDRLSWRLRGERRKTAPRWASWMAAAAMFGIAFCTGLVVSRRTPEQTGTVATNTSTTTTTANGALTSAAGASSQQQRDRILLVVVGDHFDESERVLVELTNLMPQGEVDVSTERTRAEELLVSNRLYRRTALDRGEDQVATLLDELEPVLLQLAHGPSQMTPDELRRIQKRVEAKGLVFKLRVLRADVRATAMPHLQQQPNT